MEFTTILLWALLMTFDSRDSRNSSDSVDLGGSQAVHEPGICANAIADIDFVIRSQSDGCGGRIVLTNTSTAHIQSPTDEGGVMYRDRASCFWLVTGPEGKHLKLTQDPNSVFEIAEDCGEDKLTIQDVEYCLGNLPLTTHVVTSNRAVVTFKSDYANGGQGFFIKIETEVPGSYIPVSVSPSPVPSLVTSFTPAHYTDYFGNDTSNLTSLDRLLRKRNTDCGGIITVTSTSPGLLRPPMETGDGATNYAYGASCIWIVINPNSGQMKFTQDPASPFDIPECLADKLLIQGTSYCNSNPFTNKTISFNTAVVVFTSDYSVSGRGFTIKIEAVPETSDNATLGTHTQGDSLHTSNDIENKTPAALDWQNDDWQLKHLSRSSGCGGIVTATNTSAGYMKSPAVNESGYYPDEAFCIWRAEAPDGMRLKFTQEPSSAFDIAEGCFQDKLDIAGMEFCRYKPLGSLTVPFSKTIAIFQSDYSLSGTGFDIKVEAVE